MEKMLEYLGNIIDAYNSGDTENVQRYGNEFDASLEQCYPKGGAEKCHIDTMAQTFVLSSSKTYGEVISDKDRDDARAKYELIMDASER